MTYVKLVYPKNALKFLMGIDASAVAGTEKIKGGDKNVPMSDM